MKRGGCKLKAREQDSPSKEKEFGANTHPMDYGAFERHCCAGELAGESAGESTLSSWALSEFRSPRCRLHPVSGRLCREHFQRSKPVLSMEFVLQPRRSF